VIARDKEIREIHGKSRGAYGAPRVHAALRRKGQAINRKKVEWIMRERDIRGMTRRKRRYLTKQDTKAAPAPDLVGRDFTAAEPGTKLVGDITYLATIEGWWYLATVIDLATREVIGCAMADHCPAPRTRRAPRGKCDGLHPAPGPAERTTGIPGSGLRSARGWPRGRR
jgi:transposase InsO family protein